MTEKESDNIEDAIWALVFFGIGTIIFMNRTAIHGAGFIFAGALSFFVGCVFVGRLLIKPRR
jgi:hypothetical protein